MKNYWLDKKNAKVNCNVIKGKVYLLSTGLNQTMTFDNMTFDVMSFDNMTVFNDSVYIASETTSLSEEDLLEEDETSLQGWIEFHS